MIAIVIRERRRSAGWFIISSFRLLLLLQVVWVTTNGVDVPVPTSVTVSRITCTSALVSWNEVADNVDYEISWRLLVDGWEGSERSQGGGVATISGLNHYMLENLLTSDDNVMMRYGVRVSSVKQGVKGSYCSEIVFSTNTNAVPVQPFATPSESGVIIKWSTPHLNTACDGNVIREYSIRYNPVGSSNVTTVPVEPKLNVIVNIDDIIPFTDYQYTVVAVDQNGRNAYSDLKYFTTQNDLPTSPSLLSAELDSNSITVTWEAPSDASAYNISQYLIKVIPLTGSSAIPIYHSYANKGTSLQSETIPNLIQDTLYKISVASESRIGLGSLSVDHLLAHTTSFIPTAPVDLDVGIVNNHMLEVSWTYPSTEQITSFEVTYSLVSAYNTVAGVKTFAEYDTFNTTETLFHFALVSSVTNYIFTVTPYSATHAGDSARVMVNDFSQVDLVEDPVIFFNLRITSTSSSFYSDIKKGNSELTREIESSINEICQCTLPSYTLRGSMDLCDSQSNCTIYTGRILGSDKASASEVFKMVQDYLSMQNGSLLDSTLSIDPTCPLRRLSPSDMACSFAYNITNDEETDPEGADPTEADATEETNPTEETDPTEQNDDPNNDRRPIDMVQMLAIGFSIGCGVIICAGVICACACKSRKMMKRKKSNTLPYSESEARLAPFLRTPDTHRHYSVVVERNPSYNHHRNNAVKPLHTILPNGSKQGASFSGSLNSENPYAYTSLKTAQRQADALAIHQQHEGVAHITVEQLERHNSEMSNNDYVVESLTSSAYYSKENGTSTFHPSSTPNSQASYLSVS